MKEYPGFLTTIVHLPDGNICEDYWRIDGFIIYGSLKDRFTKESIFNYMFPIPYINNRKFPVRIAELSEDFKEIWLEEAWGGK